MTQRQVPTVHSFILLVQLLDKVLDVPVVVLRQVPDLMVQKTVVRPQLPSIYGRRHSLSFSRGSSPRSRLSIHQTTEILQLVFVFRWSMPMLCWSCSFSCAAVETFLAFPKLQLFEKSPLVVFRLHKTADFPQLQFITVVVFLS